MSKCIRLAVFAFFTAFVFGFIISENAHGMGLYGTDENGRQVNVIDVDKYLKQNPYRPPARNSAPKPKPRPVAKKPAPKPKPVAKKPAPKPKYVPFDTKSAVKRTVTTSVAAGTMAAIVTGGAAAIPTAALSGSGAIVSSVVEWGYDNLEYGADKTVRGVEKVAKEYQRISVLEDPMGKSFPH